VANLRHFLGKNFILFKEKNVLAKFPYCLEKPNIPRKRGKKKLPKKNCHLFIYLFIYNFLKKICHNCIMKQ